MEKMPGKKRKRKAVLGKKDASSRGMEKSTAA
jgi:hypothetical protein